MCRIFKCNRAGKYIGFYNRLEDAMRDNPVAQRDWFFTNGETLSVWMFDGSRWIDTNRAVGAVNMVDNPETFVPDVLAGESKTYFYLAPQAGEYTFTNFGGISVLVEKPSLISLNWNGIEWGDTICEFPVHGGELLPEVELRFVSLPGEDPSEVYGSRESNTIKDCYVEFRISQGWDFINREKENIYLCLNRWKSKSVAMKFFDSSGTSAEMVCSGGKMKMSHDEGHANFVSLTLGLCLAIKDLSVTNYEKWIKSCMTAFCGRMGYTQKLGLFYNATLYGKNRFVK